MFSNYLQVQVGAGLDGLPGMQTAVCPAAQQIEQDGVPKVPTISQNIPEQLGCFFCPFCAHAAPPDVAKQTQSASSNSLR
jgi:hypothetical protein